MVPHILHSNPAPADPNISEEHILVLHYKKFKNGGEKVEVRGSISDIGSCYKTIEMGKDIIRKHNELNNGYLHFEQVEPLKKT
jgi:hypothetical protein